MREYNIKCSNCGYEIQVEKAISKQVEERVKQEFEKTNEKQGESLKKQKQALENEIAEFEEKKRSEEASAEKLIEEALSTHKDKLKNEAAAEVGEKIKKLEQENADNVKEIRELKKREVSLLKAEKELIEKQEYAEIELQKKLLEEKDSIEKEARKKESEKNESLIKQYDKKLNEQRKTIEELKAQLENSIPEQESIKDQPSLLTKEFPKDDIKQAGKVNDCTCITHAVKNEDGIICGRILYVTCNTADFSKGFIDSVKAAQKASEAVITLAVSAETSEELDFPTNKDGVWFCAGRDMKNTAFILREMLIREYAAAGISKTKDLAAEKMERMDEYITSEEFRNKVETIVESFCSLKEQIDKEKRAMMSIWEQRVKQLEIAIENMTGMYGTIKGIGGKRVGDIEKLEL